MPKKIKLKGGSLSGTYYVLNDDGHEFVRKECSLIHNREYGFQRWYSQLKRLQRYGKQYPNIFPNIIRYGISDSVAYFDMDYINDSVTLFEYLCNTSDHKKIELAFDALLEVMMDLYNLELDSFPGSIGLYLHEEVERRISDCLDNNLFLSFVQHKIIVFNENPVQGLYHSLQKYSKIFNAAYTLKKENFTHGNLTLENILYQPKSNRIIFVDPYEENIIDSKITDYSQLLQSCNSFYEVYNASKPVIQKNSVKCIVTIPDGLIYFRELLMNHISNNFSREDRNLMGLFEISQYARMLPFKKEMDEKKMILFYAVGSELFDRYLLESV